MPNTGPRGDRRTAPTRGHPRRCGAAIKTYAFFRTCPGREAVKLPVISPENSIEPHARHLATQGVNSNEFGVESTRRFRATRRASPVARPEPHGRTHSLFTMSKNTPRPEGEAMRRPAVPAANSGCGRRSSGWSQGLVGSSTVPPRIARGRWWSKTGSNRRPHACKARALPTELLPLGLRRRRRRPSAWLAPSGAAAVRPCRR